MSIRKTALFSALCCATFFSWADTSSETGSTSLCPDTFYSLPLYPQARLCNVFAGDLPASMSYHADASQTDTRDFYVEQLGEPEREQQVKGRTVLEFADASRIVIISVDGSGSQVDILIKS